MKFIMLLINDVETMFNLLAMLLDKWKKWNHVGGLCPRHVWLN